MDVMLMLQRMGGAARQSALLDAGVNRNHIRKALATGAIKRPFRGCLALPHVSFDQSLACYFNGRLTCLSAAKAHGVRVLKHATALHLEVPAQRGGHRHASLPHRLVHLHRSRTFEPGGLVVAVARAIDMAAHCTTPLGQLVMIDHALGQGWLREHQIAEFSITPLRTRRWLAIAADPKAGSVSETCARVAMRRAGLELESQPLFADGRRSDFLVEGRVYVEVDGYEFHSNRRQFEEDRARDRYLMSLGYRVLRFTYGDAVRAPERLVADVRAVLSASVR